ncbi:uncharacterized protein LOC135483685 [Lineus longissimus]|uniref:uncharacterized protein LOC135483685 n=1 Tax=Lineus longissimus TaxID=88925 RepID=UPI00315C75A9
MVVFYAVLISVSITAFAAATFYFTRRHFLMLSAIPLFIYGVGFYAVPGLMLTMSVVSGSPGPEHLVAYSHQGEAFLGTVALFFFLRKSDDDSVTGWLLSQVAQTSLAQAMALACFHYSQSYKLEHGERPIVLLNTEVNRVLYIGMGLWFLVTVLQFLRKPALQSKSSGLSDNRMTIHRTIVTYSTFLISLFMIANPDMIRTSKHELLMDDVEKFAYQLAGAFFLTQAWAADSSKNFTHLKDQAGVFKAHLVLIFLGCLSQFSHVMTGKIHVLECSPTLAASVFLAMNSFLALHRLDNLQIKSNEKLPDTKKKP